MFYNSKLNMSGNSQSGQLEPKRPQEFRKYWKIPFLFQLGHMREIEVSWTPEQKLRKINLNIAKDFVTLGKFTAGVFLGKKSTLVATYRGICIGWKRTHLKH